MTDVITSHNIYLSSWITLYTYIPSKTISDSGCILKWMFSLHVTSMSDSWIWGSVLGSLQGGSNNSVRHGAIESGQICISFEEFELGNFSVAQKVIMHMCSLHSVLWITSVEGYRWQITTATLSELGRSRT